MATENPARKPKWRRWFGDRSEHAAAKFLRGIGYSVLARNYTCKLGELDLVALDGEAVVFVEVRSTGENDEQRPALSVNHTKQQKLTKLATYFLQRKRLLECSARFDVVTVHWPASRKSPEIQHFPNAFEAVDY